MLRGAWPHGEVFEVSVTEQEHREWLSKLVAAARARYNDAEFNEWLRGVNEGAAGGRDEQQGLLV